MASSTSDAPRRGRPQKYPLTRVQEKSIRTRILRGESTTAITGELNVHAFAVLRVRRQMKKEN
jgi:hypothetical protein